MEQIQVETLLRGLRQGSESGDRICTELVGEIQADAIFLFPVIKVTQTLSKNFPSTETYKEEIKIA